MKTSERQITLFIDPDELKSKQTLAYAKGEGIAVREVDVTQEHLSTTRFFELAEQLGVSLEKLVNKEHPDFEEAGMDPSQKMDSHGWAQFLQQYPRIMRTPIALKGNQAMILEQPTDILYL